MQTLLRKYSSLNFVQNYGFKKQQMKKSAAKRSKYYAANPEMFGRISKISKKIDFKSESLQFPIRVPLKFRYVYRPQKHLFQLTPKIVDYVNFKVLQGNEILLYLEQAQHLRPDELIEALFEVQKRDKEQCMSLIIYLILEHDLRNHPWVQRGIEQGLKELSHLSKVQVTKFMWALYRLNVESGSIWEILEKKAKEMTPKMSAKGFGAVYHIFVSERGSEEFRRELSLLLPIHLRNMSPQMIADCFELSHRYGLLSEYLFEEHFHQLIWKRTAWLIQSGQLPKMLGIIREMKYEDDEFLWPDVYKKIGEWVEEVKAEHYQELYNALMGLQIEFGSHQQYGLQQIIQKLEDKISWEDTLGKQARSLSLVEIVKNDLMFYKERTILRMQQEGQYQ